MSFSLNNTKEGGGFFLEKRKFGKGSLSIFRKFFTNNLLVRLDSNNKNSVKLENNIWLDTTGNNNNGLLEGGLNYSLDNDGIFELDGINQFIKINHQPNLSITPNNYMTYQLWVNIGQLPPIVDTVPILSKISSDFGFDGFFLRVQPDASLRLVTNGASINRTSNSLSNIISPNQWYFVTVIIKISSDVGSISVYLNTDKIISNQHGNDTINEQNFISLGYSGDGLGNDYLSGKIGSFFVYNRELSPAEINQNYIATKNRFLG